MSKHPLFEPIRRAWSLLLALLLLNSLTFAHCVLPPPNQLVRETLYNVPAQTGSWGVVLLENVPSGYTVTNNTFYLAWCVNAVASIVPGPPGYAASLYDTSDPADLAALGVLGVPVGSNQWNKVNYLLNHKGGANPTTLQAAIWRITNPPAAPQEPSMVAGTYLPQEGFPPADLNQINALEAAANANPTFVPGPGQVTGAYLYVPGTQPLVIEVVCPGDPSNLGSIGDTVFCDYNRDCVQQVGEPGLPGVKVTLTGNNLTQTAFTNATGNYLFDDLPAGNYTVTVDPATAPAGCNIVLDNCPLNETVPLADGQSYLEADFCFGTNGTIGDTVFCDFNRDGVQQLPNEPGLEGVKVTLTGSNIVPTTVTTDASGNYRFIGLAPGTYTVTVDQTTAPAGCNVFLTICPPTKTVSLALAQNYVDADFCFGANGIIGDTVFCDANRDGMQQQGEPGLEHVKVTIAGSNISTTTAFTDNNGKYLFSNLPPGTYTVTVDQTTAPAGCNVVIPTCPLSRSVTLTAGQTYLTADFCFGKTTNGLVTGDTGTIGFWANKNGQALIKAANGSPSSKALATWLATNFPYLYGANAGGNNLTGKTNTDVAALFIKLKNISGMKTDAQIMAGALASYLTNSTLAGNVAASYNLNVSAAGTGAKTYNVGSYGTAIGLVNNTSYTVLQLLQQANLRKQTGTFNANAFNVIFTGINEMGDRL